MRITVIAGGVGGARFVRGVREWARRESPDSTIDVVVNTGDDAWVAGLRITPDLDSIMYTLAGVNDEQRGWGRVGETERVSAELREWGVGWPWFTLGDLDLGAHIARTSWLREGLPLSTAVERLTARWPLGVRLLPATDAEAETHVHVRDPEGGDRVMHFQEWWTRHRAALPAVRFEQRGVEQAVPAPGVLEAIGDADVVLVAPSNPVVSIGTVLAVPGIRDAVRGTAAPVVGVSPIIGGAAVRGMADACLTAIGVRTAADAVAGHYGARSRGGVLDSWLLAEEDAALVDDVRALGLRTEAAPLWMRDSDTSAALARDAVRLAGVID
ncbi:LPPG:FO 2-phospho-L-lactate transferase [Diaminobutyricimonas aerilata]|uniref:LPPG:FO 2-phospho-L-lactate transferase n=1 Tax=Diaminobutyricimonas aerilata TaxID=1162967 RepID=A0A2M9CIL6_9MICO|nr:2-phospho-L-lactate transferase [Diaminobutyricimonas aerilata]PJJ71710.1 LPPG:FO 2-phospho-L-lactate transferase [Diaminobutyricimonas aerilata]